MAKKPASNKVFGDLVDLKAEFDKKYGEGTVRFSGDEAITNVEAVPTGVISLDKATGIGGIPRGRIIEIFGPESSGKTTTCLQIAAAFQRHIFKTPLGDRPGRVAFIDAEHALDPEWADKIGCNVSEFIFCQPDHGQQAYDIIEMIIKSGKVELVILDSIAALAPKEEIEGELEDNQIGAQARLNSKALRRLKGVMNDYGCTLMCVNQVREKIGVMFGNPETTPGGRALKFYASMRMEIRRGSQFKIGEEHVGFETKAKFIKNKVARPFTEATYNICFGDEKYPVAGIDPFSNLLEAGTEAKVITQKGSHYSFDGEVLGNGGANAATALRLSPNIFKKIYDLTIQKAIPTPCPTPLPSTNPETSST
jgi:recombination protein RecA